MGILAAYALLAGWRGWAYRWIGIGALLFLVGSAVGVALALEPLAEQVAQASYFWFIAFAVGLIIEALVHRQDSAKPVVAAEQTVAKAPTAESFAHHAIDGVRAVKKRRATKSHKRA